VCKKYRHREIKNRKQLQYIISFLLIPNQKQKKESYFLETQGNNKKENKDRLRINNDNYSRNKYEQYKTKE